MEELQFYDKKEQVLNTQRVTLRLVKETEDKYDHLQAADQFIFNISESDPNETRSGLILAHWTLPLEQIPAELLAGEGYTLDVDCAEDLYETLTWILQQKVINDLKQYYKDIDNNPLLHIIVYSPEEYLSDNLFQSESEDPYHWLARCGNKVFGHIEMYNKLVECE